MSSDSIRVHGISGRGFHGVLPEERRDGQEFVVDVDLRLDLSAACDSDALTQTVDYGAIANLVVVLIEGEPARLIEVLAQRIATSVLGYELVESVEVTVHKPQAPISVPFNDVSVTVVRHR